MSPSEQSKFKGKKKKRQNAKPIKKTRKEVRKEQRKQKKVARAVYFQNRKELRVKHKREHENVQSTYTPLNENGERKTIQYDTVNENAKIQKQHTKERKKLEVERKKEKQRKKLLNEANMQEDKIIKKLEKQLKLNKRKKNTIPKSFVADGLDYILDFCIEENRKTIVETEKQLLGNETDTEFKTDLLMVTGEDVLEDQCTSKVSCDQHNKERMETDIDKDNDSIDFSSDTDLANNNDSFQDDSSEASQDEMLQHDISVSEEHLSNDNEIEVKEKLVMTDNENLWEDIYGRKRDKQGNIIASTTKYLPPAVRAITEGINSADPKLFALRKQLKGCLNRVAEHNMHSIANQIDELYMTNSRNDMNDIISKLMMEAIVAPVLTPDRMVCEHMMLIAILHANVGVEVGAQFLETLVKKFNEMQEVSQDVENKRLDNVVLMITHLYNFKIYGHRLLYQILDKLLIKFTEKEIELILLILKTVGFPLRKDDPIALKEFIQIVQQKASQTKGENSRVKFMLDVLLAIKNNNVSKIPQYDASYIEHLKKVVKSVIRKGNTVTQFNVSLDDLLHADERGKWWVIGSAWSGSNDLTGQTKVKNDNKLIFGDKILELARKQRMNTDTRRNVFCVLMTAEDYLDAFEKLHHLGLRDQQEREVIHVLMHCCLQEKKFNPYYAILAQKLCEYNRKYHLTIQYTFWDKLKTLESYKAKQLSNLARFLTHLFVEKCLPLSILKVVEFAELDKHTMRLLRQIILGILLHKNEENCLQVFEKISASPQLQNFRESLRLFVSHFLIKNITDNDALGEKEITLKERAQLVDKILTSRGSRVIF